MTGTGSAVGQVVDAHVHFWDPRRLTYPWLAALPALDRTFLPADYVIATTGAGIGQVVFVEANCTPSDGGREVQLIETLAVEATWIGGVVAFVNLSVPALPRAALDALARSRRVKGVRQNIQGEPDGFCLQPAFIRGVREVGRRGLTFDVCVTHDQLADAVELVRRCPETRFVLDHGGKPAIGYGRIDRWRTDIARLAMLPNVWCKLSGLLTEAEADHRREEDLAPFADHIVECFGSSRMMYGSDWPVITTAGSCAQWLEFTRRFVDKWTDVDKRRFFHDNAVDFYAL
ncbi:MAG: amidohydrolase family protein [Gemmatimonadaceae bacterium]